MDAREWHCFRVRPANHPRRRVGGAASDCWPAALTGRWKAGWWRGFSRLAAWREHPRRLTDALTVTDGGVTYVGSDRAKEMAVNVVLPFPPWAGRDQR